MIISYSITEVGRLFYRPLIYSNHVFDYYITDTLGSSFGTLTAMFMVILLVGKEKLKDIFLLLGIIAGLLLYEISAIGKAGYDLHDMIAILIFGTIGLLIYYILIKSSDVIETTTTPVKQNPTQKA